MTYPSISTPSGPPASFTVVLFSGFQLLDACGPLDILNILSEDRPEMVLNLVSDSLDPVSSKHPALKGQNPLFTQALQPTHTFKEFLQSNVQTDVLMIPGGIGTRAPEGGINPTLDFLKEYLSRDLVKHSVFTVCTGSRALAQTGYLNGAKATTNKILFKTVTGLYPDVDWVKKARWVRDGEIWTCSGITAGLDGMLAFVAAWWSADIANDIARALEYKWCGLDGRELDDFADMAE